MGRDQNMVDVSSTPRCGICSKLQNVKRITKCEFTNSDRCEATLYIWISCENVFEVKINVSCHNLNATDLDIGYG